jgi:hypothetical protein
MKIMTNLEILRMGTPKQIADMLCKCLKNCSACPHSIRECCNGGENGFEEWLNEAAKTLEDASNDAPNGALNGALKGWIKLKIVKGDIYVNASAIVGLKHAMNTVSGELTAVYTIGRDSPWHVYGSIDEIMGKIEKA